MNTPQTNTPKPVDVSTNDQASRNRGTQSTPPVSPDEPRGIVLAGLDDRERNLSQIQGRAWAIAREAGEKLKEIRTRRRALVPSWPKPLPQKRLNEIAAVVGSAGFTHDRDRPAAFLIAALAAAGRDGLTAYECSLVTGYDTETAGRELDRLIRRDRVVQLHRRRQGTTRRGWLVWTLPDYAAGQEVRR